jgi:hypothetical protein
MKGTANFHLAAALFLIAGPLAAEGRLDFRTRVLPVLTRAGCNGGACHGAATGQGGFKPGARPRKYRDLFPLCGNGHSRRLAGSFSVMSLRDPRLPLRGPRAASLALDNLSEVASVLVPCLPQKSLGHTLAYVRDRAPSLLGYDPEEDDLRITREHRGRRVDLEAPEESLLPGEQRMER